jgi:hypothetical protein
MRGVNMIVRGQYVRTINVKKDELLKVLQENRAKHREVFEAALDGYRTYAVKVLNEKVKALSRGKQPEIRIMIDRPEDHTRDYDRVIGMVQADQAELFELSETDFAQYWEDDWSWKRQWAKLSSSYATESYTANYGAVPPDDDW